mmetsp:Transcript_20871/g.34400  ORF Transcript_20871/g.34400 Transcript_20871/m.34400 type:complete len:248 (+) Transcript_20871:593-1336(+)
MMTSPCTFKNKLKYASTSSKSLLVFKCAATNCKNCLKHGFSGSGGRERISKSTKGAVISFKRLITASYDPSAIHSDNVCSSLPRGFSCPNFSNLDRVCCCVWSPSLTSSSSFPGPSPSCFIVTSLVVSKGPNCALRPGREGRKKGAAAGALGGSVGLFRSLIRSMSVKCSHLDRGASENVTSPSLLKGSASYDWSAMRALGGREVTAPTTESRDWSAAGVSSAAAEGIGRAVGSEGAERRGSETALR